jgi:UDP-3-O-acyl N-acetylglucosamine deacetylase
MQPFRNQRTISKTARVDGFGYWSGRDVRVEFRPAPLDAGIVFVRGDLSPPARVPAIAANRIEIPRRTTITAAGARVEMIEHIMAALAGLGVDNCEVWVDEIEMPGCDGSALAFTEALIEAGLVEQDAPRRRLIIKETSRLGDDQCWIEARPSSSEGLTLKVRIDYGGRTAIGRQTLELSITPEVFRKQLAPCRTFLLKEEADWLLSQGLGARVKPSDLLVFGPLGVVDNRLRFSDECVRHKMLDLIGDLSLAGCEIWGHVIAHCSGHRLNCELVRVLLAEGEIVEARRRIA